MKRRILALLLVLLVLPLSAVLADAPRCTFNTDGTITCTTGGGGDGGGDGNGSNPTPPPLTCTPGATMWVQRFTPDDAGTCTMYTALVDQCTGGVLDLMDNLDEGVPCPEAPLPPPRHPCTRLTVSSGGVTCAAGDGWHVEATVGFPATYLDVRPFPATLVRWPTAIRNGGTPSASGAGKQAYYGTGSKGHPNAGDWSDITLTLTLNPAGPLRVDLPQVGGLTLADRGASGSPWTIRWEVPSHPAAGGGPLAGAVSGMDELPADLPLFVGSGRAPYRLFWQLRYFVYEAITDCLDGPNSSGEYNCGGGTGHRQVVGHEWRKHTSGGEISPSAVTDLPAALAADLNGDGAPDAYWNRNLTIRRMDDANRVDNPSYRRSWNWGGAIYWAVREGQGQIGWPRNP